MFHAWIEIDKVANFDAEHTGLFRARRSFVESDARFIFANFEDTDMLYGHRNDTPGFAKCLEEFDQDVLKPLIAKLRADDLFILTADHGNDPTDVSTDHTREYIPCSIVGGTQTGNLGDIDGFSYCGKTVADHLGIEN